MLGGGRLPGSTAAAGGICSRHARLTAPGIGATVTEPALVEVRLLRFPLPLWARSQEHVDELLREFALIAESEDHQSVPRRLLALIAELTASYAGISSSPEQHRDDALARGETVTDLLYHVPAGASEAIRHLGEMLDLADEYCRQGSHLLTLQTPADQLAFRRWFLDEFIVQLAGGPATPWSPDVAPG
jgi:hypothetical protein